MPKTLIEQFPTESRLAPDDGSGVLHISELFCDTIQGEGSTSGIPATFLRLQGCTLACVWCDTLEVWKVGNPYTVNEVLALFKKNGMVEKFRKGQRLILTGGSPLKQEDGLMELLLKFEEVFGFMPTTEIENEVVKMPSLGFAVMINTWNNSPKLENSGMKSKVRYKPEVIAFTAKLKNSTFKFVISKVEDWDEIEEFYLKPGLIDRSQIILMPEGQTREELAKSYEAVVEVCVRENVIFRNREHIVIWNKKTGV